MADESLHINHGLIALGLQLSASLGKIGEGRSFDDNREYVDPNCPIGEDEIEVVAVQAAFSREVTAEIEGIVAGLEADEIVFASDGIRRSWLGNAVSISGGGHGM